MKTIKELIYEEYDKFDSERTIIEYYATPGQLRRELSNTEVSSADYCGLRALCKGDATSILYAGAILYVGPHHMVEKHGNTPSA